MKCWKFMIGVMGFIIPSMMPLWLHGADIPVAQGASLRLAGDGFQFTEGPAADREGNIWFTDQPNDRILKWNAATGEITTFLQPCGRANGLYFQKDGSLLACADEKGEIRRIDATTGKFTVLLNRFQGKLFNGPNDVWVHPKGGLYFTDPFYKRDYWKGREVMEQASQRVFYLPSGSDVPIIADEALVQPNGIIGSPDGRLLYVADIAAKKTYRYDIKDDGKLENRRIFCEMGSDGMTLDSAGNVYLTGNGVTVFNREGAKLGEVKVPENWTANICFGGRDFKTLFITASDAVYTLEMAVSGAR